MATLTEKRKYLKNWLLFTPPLRDFLNDQEVIAELRDGMRLAVRGTRKSDFFAMTSVIFDNVYQIEKIKDPKTILDIGANIGSFAILAARRFPNAKVIAVEPAPTNIVQLKKNISLNGLRNIQVVEYAVSDKKGKAELFIDVNRDSAHSFLKDIGEGSQRSASIMVPTVPLSYFGRVDAMKIDCEGAEFQILNNDIPDCQYIAIEFDIEKENLGKQFMRAGYTTRDLSDITVFIK